MPIRKTASRYKLSVIIPTYNRAELLSYSLDSLCSQKIEKDDFEVVVADDGSTDDTRLMLERFRSKINIKYVYQEDKGYRPGSARNLGVSVAESPICVFIDSGVLLHENCLLAHLQFHRDNPNSAAIGIVYGFEENDYLSDELKKLIVPGAATKSIEIVSGSNSFSDVRTEHYRKYDYRIDELPAPWLYFWTCHVSVGRSQLMSVNLFDANYDGRWGVEDNDLAFRLLQNGVKISLLRNAESIHYPHEKDKQGRHQEGYQNCLYFNNKFNTIETQLFLKHYLDMNFFDVNAEAMRLMKVDQTA